MSFKSITTKTFLFELVQNALERLTEQGRTEDWKNKKQTRSIHSLFKSLGLAL